MQTLFSVAGTLFPEKTNLHVSHSLTVTGESRSFWQFTIEALDQAMKDTIRFSRQKRMISQEQSAEDQDQEEYGQV